MYGDNNKINKYVSQRMSRKDDRCSEEKRWDDAKLRGEIGSKAANRVIKHIDEMKSWC